MRLEAPALKMIPAVPGRRFGFPFFIDIIIVLPYYK